LGYELPDWKKGPGRIVMSLQKTPRNPRNEAGGP
jgi:hypothetical protein